MLSVLSRRRLVSGFKIENSEAGKDLWALRARGGLFKQRVRTIVIAIGARDYRKKIRPAPIIGCAACRGIERLVRDREPTAQKRARAYAHEIPDS